MIGWILLAAAVLLLAGLLIAGWYLMKAVCGRRELPDLSDKAALDRYGWNETHPGIQEAQQWLQQQPVQDLQVISYDNKLLHGRFIPCDHPRGTLLLFHGYHASCDLDYAPTMEYYHSQNFNLLLVDQRAHGRSQGRFLTFGVKERYDVVSWVTYLTLMLGEDHPMFLLGMSMGSATVMMAADQELPHNVRGIIADCGYTTPHDIIYKVIQARCPRFAGAATAFFGFFSRLYGDFSIRGASSPEALRHSPLPVLLLHGLADDFVPCSMSEQCRDACHGEVKLLEFPGAAHCRSFPSDPKRYKAAVEAFFNNHLEKRDEPHDTTCH